MKPPCLPLDAREAVQGSHSDLGCWNGANNNTDVCTANKENAFGCACERGCVHVCVWLHTCVHVVHVFVTVVCLRGSLCKRVCVSVYVCLCLCLRVCV